VSANKIYVACARRLIPSEVSPGGKVKVKLADLTAWKAEEVARKARRDREKVDAARTKGIFVLSLPGHTETGLELYNPGKPNVQPHLDLKQKMLKPMLPT